VAERPSDLSRLLARQKEGKQGDSRASACHSLGYAEYRAVAAAGALPFPALEPMLGHWTPELEELDCDPVPVWLLDWPLEDVVDVVLLV